MSSVSKIYAFIDSQNLNLGIKGLGWNLDFGRFRRYLRDKYKTEKAFLFIGYVPGNEGLYKSLQEAGYLLVFKPVVINKDGVVKGNVDAELVLHSMIEFPEYDGAVIVSGDGDFHCLVEYLEQKGKLSRLLIPNPNRYSALLRRFRCHFAYLHQLEQKIGKGAQKHKERE